MMPDGFEKMKGRVYVKFEGTNKWSEVEELCCLDDVIELIEERIKKKRLQEGMEKLKEKFKERKLKDHMQEHVAVILHELLHSQINHPDNKWPWESFDFVHQTAVMMEEAGEAVREANTMREKNNYDLRKLYNELAQTGAMCLRIMEQVKEYALRTD